MKRLLALYFLLLSATYSKAQLNLLGWCGSNANFAMEYLGNDKIAVAHFNVLEFYDVSTPSSPSLVTTLNLPPTFPVLAMCKWGNYLLTEGYQVPAQFSIVDVSNINSPSVVGSCGWGNYTGLHIQVFNNYAYVSGYDSIFVYDISNVTAPFFAYQFFVQGNHDLRNILIKDQLLLAQTDLGLNVFSINTNGTLQFDTLHSQVDGYLFESGNDSNQVFILNGANLKVYDISNVNSPVLINQFSLSNPNAANLISKQNYIYTYGSDFDVYRLQSSSLLHIATYPNSWAGSDLQVAAKDSSLIFYATRDSVLIFSFNPNSSVGINYIPETPDKFYSIFYDNNITSIKSKANDLSFYVLNTNGQLVLNKGINKGEQFNFKDLPGGFYFLKIINESNHIHITEKIIIYNEFR